VKIIPKFAKIWLRSSGSIGTNYLQADNPLSYATPKEAKNPAGHTIVFSLHQFNVLF
jgi:hypothetical protein